MKHQILVLEDDMDMQEALRVSLRDFDCLFCMTLAQGLQEAAGDWDLILLDLGLPDGNGLELLQAVRLESDVPVLVLSAQTDQPVILEAYAQKADDYITKPVRLPVLKAKIGRLLEQEDIRQFGTVTLYVSGCRMDGAAEVMLTGTETAVLEPLFAAAGKPVSSQRILRSVARRTGFDMSLETLSVRFSGLRRKLGKSGLMIRGDRRHGYWLEEADHESAS